MARNTETQQQQLELINEKTERSICTYAQRAFDLLTNTFSMRSHLEEVDKAYMREADYTEAQLRARLANRAGDKTKIQDVTVPIVMPQVRSALGYLTNVFLTGYPLFGVAADPSMEDAALQMETIIGENAITAGWARQLMMFFNDGLKYNLHGIECEWQQKTVWTIENDATMPNSAKPKKVLWNGNVLRRMDLYNTFFDPRVHPAEIHEKGEYAGYIELMSRIQMKKYINDMFGKVPVSTVMRAFETSVPNSGSYSATGSPFGYYTPIINPAPLIQRGNLQTFDWLSWAEAMPANRPQVRYTNIYEVAKLYARILPSDFGMNVSEKNMPQVWKFIIINRSVVLWAERMPNIHNFIPIFFGQPLEDGLDYQTKSFADNVMDLQDTASALWNGYIASKRRLVGDRVIYDPLRIRAKDIKSQDPAAKIPVRPSAYGKNVAESVYAFPYRDEQTQTMLNGADLVIRYADKVNQQNPAQQGQFVKGNKTLHEYEDVMGHGNSGNQMMAISTEGQVFTPMKEVIKLNILQFQEADTLYNRDKQKNVQVQPTDLRKAAVHFKISDGIAPIDKLINGDELTMALQQLGSSPTLAAGYNIAPLFTYLMKTRNVDLSPFEKSPLQMEYENAVAQWKEVAIQAIKAGQPAPPQPQMPPALQQELQQKQQSGGSSPSPTAAALETTQGSGSATQ